MDRGVRGRECGERRADVREHAVRGRVAVEAGVRVRGAEARRRRRAAARRPVAAVSAGADDGRADEAHHRADGAVAHDRPAERGDAGRDAGNPFRARLALQLLRSRLPLPAARRRARDRQATAAADGRAGARSARDARLPLRLEGGFRCASGVRTHRRGKGRRATQDRDGNDGDPDHDAAGLRAVHHCNHESHGTEKSDGDGDADDAVPDRRKLLPMPVQHGREPVAGALLGARLRIGAHRPRQRAVALGREQRRVPELRHGLPGRRRRGDLHEQRQWLLDPAGDRDRGPRRRPSRVRLDALRPLRLARQTAPARCPRARREGCPGRHGRARVDGIADQLDRLRPPPARCRGGRRHRLREERRALPHLRQRLRQPWRSPRRRRRPREGDHELPEVARARPEKRDAPRPAGADASDP